MTLFLTHFNTDEKKLTAVYQIRHVLCANDLPRENVVPSTFEMKDMDTAVIVQVVLWCRSRNTHHRREHTEHQKGGKESIMMRG